MDCLKFREVVCTGLNSILLKFLSIPEPQNVICLDIGSCICNQLRSGHTGHTGVGWVLDPI